MFQVKIAKLPGTGLNSGQGQVWNDSAYAEYLNKVFSTINSDVFIFGHSNSGTIAAKLSNLIPEKVAGLILADTTGMGRHSYLRTLLARTLDGIYELKFTFRAGSHLLINVLFHPMNFLHQVHLSVKNDARSDFQKVKVPTFLMWGKRDHTMPVKDALGLKKLISDSILIFSQRGSHDWALTNADDFSERLKSYLISTH